MFKLLVFTSLLFALMFGCCAHGRLLWCLGWWACIHLGIDVLTATLSLPPQLRITRIQCSETALQRQDAQRHSSATLSTLTTENWKLTVTRAAAQSLLVKTIWSDVCAAAKPGFVRHNASTSWKDTHKSCAAHGRAWCTERILLQNAFEGLSLLRILQCKLWLLLTSKLKIFVCHCCSVCAAKHLVNCLQDKPNCDLCGFA